MRKAYRIVEGKSGGKRPVMRSYEIEVQMRGQVVLWLDGYSILQQNLNVCGYIKSDLNVCMLQWHI